MSTTSGRIHQFLDRFAHIRSRIRNIAAFSKVGRSTRDKLKMLVVGYARGHNFSGSDVIGQIGRRFFPEVSVRLNSLGELRLVIDLRDLSQLAVADEVFLQKVYDLQLVPFTPDLIVDCGAHVGMFTLLAASQFPQSKIVAVEPDPENCRWLRRHVRENRIRVDIFEAAVSTSRGEVFFEPGLGCASSVSLNPVISLAAIRVKAVDLADFICPTAKLLLKIDIEGAEESVLPEVADRLPANSFIFFETHGGEESWNRLSGMLRQRGFTTNITRLRETFIDGTAARFEPVKTRFQA